MSSAEQFLIDTSAAVRVQRPHVYAAWADALEQGRVGLCEPTEVELLYSAQSARHFAELKEALSEQYVWRGVPDGAWRQVRELQAKLLDAGSHRSAGIADLLVCVTAQHHGLTVLHYDRDFETVAKVTGQPERWLAPPGTLD